MRRQVRISEDVEGILIVSAYSVSRATGMRSL